MSRLEIPVELAEPLLGFIAIAQSTITSGQETDARYVVSELSDTATIGIDVAENEALGLMKNLLNYSWELMERAKDVDHIVTFYWRLPIVRVIIPIALKKNGVSPLSSA